MQKRIFLDGAVGRRLGLLLVADDWRVTGTTRSPERAALLRDVGDELVIIDMYNDWYAYGDGYSSNGYVSGLLSAAGGVVEKRSDTVPGWGKPVPAEQFHGDEAVEEADE